MYNLITLFSYKYFLEIKHAPFPENITQTQHIQSRKQNKTPIVSHLNDGGVHGRVGWSYDWNLGHSLDWYVGDDLNAIELNMSFYRFPYPNMVKSWAAKGKNLAWVVKVHRSITHYQKLSTTAVERFQRFKTLFTPLEDRIHYYLFQLPILHRHQHTRTFHRKNRDRKSRS